jgi:sorbitol-specific phosphotransferase system component IIBC
MALMPLASASVGVLLITLIYSFKLLVLFKKNLMLMRR